MSDVLVEVEELCIFGCGHPWGPHIFTAREDNLYEGWGSCPVIGCKCSFTWDVPEAKEYEKKKGGSVPTRAENEREEN